MSLFPSDSYDSNDRDIIERIKTFHKDALTYNQYFWSESDIDNRFFAGDQTLWGQLYPGIALNNRKQFSFNHVRTIVNMISGYQRLHRKSTIVVPIENGDEFTASQYTKILMWMNQENNVLETISEAFLGALISGMNLLQVWVDYRADPVNGMVRVDNCSYNSFIIDPYFRKADLSDCTAMWKRTFLTKEECLSLLPDRQDIISTIPPTETKDPKFQFMPENFNFSTANLYAYDEFYYRSYRKQKLMVDTNTGETQEWRGRDEDSLKYFLQLYPEIIIMETEIPTVKLAILIQGKCVFDDINPMGIDVYPFVPVYAYYNHQMPYLSNRIQSVIRDLRDPQFLFNRLKTIELDTVETHVNSGFIYKADSLIDPDSVWKPGQGRGIGLKKHALITDVQQITPPEIPASMMQLSANLAEEIQRVSGVSEVMMGVTKDPNASGILEMFRQGAGLVGLQGLFDQLDRSQKLLEKIRLGVIQSNFTPGKVKRIIAEEPTAQFYGKAFGLYDAAIEEGLNTTTQRQLQLAQLLQLREAGIAIPDDVILDAVTVQDKKKLTDSIKASQEQRSQMETQRAQAETQEIQARINLANARAMADEGLGYERLSRVEENQASAVERVAEAAKDENISFLNMVKALKEIDTIDLDQVHRMVALQQLIKGQEAVIKKETKPVRDKMSQAEMGVL